jgi:hypothetical protein
MASRRPLFFWDSSSKNDELTVDHIRDVLHNGDCNSQQMKNGLATNWNGPASNDDIMC